MKKDHYVFALIFILITSLNGQNKKQPNIKFDTEYFKALNHWVVLPKKESDNIYLLGYIYIDLKVGFTFVFERTMKIENNEKWITNTPFKQNVIKRRLDKTTPLVYVLLPENLIELGLPPKPLWIKLDELDENETSNLVLYGSQYNIIGESALAISFLENAYLKNTSTQNLIFELAFAYNATKQFEKAIALLYLHIASDENNYKLYRELGYALIQSKRILEAEKIYEKGIQFTENNFQKKEMAIDMAKTFFEIQNKVKLEKWIEILKKYDDLNTYSLKNKSILNNENNK